MIASMDETRVVETLREFFLRARVPSRVYAGVVQQNRQDWPDALEELCSSLGTPLVLRKSFRGRIGLNGRQEDDDTWGHGHYTRGSLARCPVATRVRMH